MNKESSLSFKNIFKRETKLATYIIACMTIVVMSVSYALFFQVTNNSKNQVVESGELKFTYSKGNEIKPQEGKESICFQPMTEEEAKLYYDECAYEFSVKNEGSLKGSYTITLEKLEGNAVTGNKLKVIFEKKTKSGQDGAEEWQSVKDFPKDMDENGNLTLVEKGELDSNATETYRVQIYVTEEHHEEDIATGATDVGKAVSYQIHGKGLVHESQPITSEPDTSAEQENVIPNTIIDEQDEEGNGLVTQNHEDEETSGGGVIR